MVIVTLKAEMISCNGAVVVHSSLELCGYGDIAGMVICCEPYPTKIQHMHKAFSLIFFMD